MSSTRLRRWVDASTTGIVTLAGTATIGLVVLLLGYLLTVVGPLLSTQSFATPTSVASTATQPVLVGSNDEGNLIHVLDRQGTLEFLDDNGTRVAEFTLADSPIGLARAGIDDDGTVAVITDIAPGTGTADGNIRFFQIGYRVTFVDGERRVAPEVDPLLTVPAEVEREPRFDATRRDDELTLALLTPRSATVDATATLSVRRWRIDPYEGAELIQAMTIPVDNGFEHLVLDTAGSRVVLYSSSRGTYAVVRIQRNRLALLGSGESAPARTATALLGDQSLLVASDSEVTQHFIRSTDGALVEARRFRFEQPVLRLLASPTDKGFVAQDEAGVIHWVHTTTHRQAVSKAQFDSSATWAFGPRGDRLLLASSDRIQSVALANDYAEVSITTLFRRVWYEGYDAPSFTWQSSAADTSFEPKFSLVPLIFGTLKAAFYAMFFAAPIGVVAAIYSAYFMPAEVRRWLKPSIELMAALPTVVLGFLAATLLAPAIEANLATVVLLVATLPIVGLAAGYGASRIAAGLNEQLIPFLWVATVPILLGYAVLLFTFDNAIETSLFGGDAAQWVTQALGIDFDQRNALVVGIAMGFAVVPVIYSIAEDAIHDVPRTLVNGSLALGASTFQTLVRVVLSTASPGIMSAIIVGFGRAVGETMVVLMATGNTPILDWNAFNGLRSLAANLAIELPESELDSTHYRVLFLTAVALFTMTFAFNTAAEVIRSRLRQRYGA